MTRNGKIARLPVAVREELNRRIEDGEAGVRLIEWLNGLPEVNAVLREHFEGQAISEPNLTQWKNGGFLDWQAQLKAESMLERWRIDSPMSEVQGPKSGEGEGGSPMSNVQGPKSEEGSQMSGKVSAALTERLMVHYAAALEDAIGGSDEKARKEVERLGRSLREVVRVRRYELARERAREQSEVGREWVALERERLEFQKARLSRPASAANKATGANMGADDKERERHMEKAAIVKQMLKDL